jgi:hypothetical protein
MSNNMVRARVEIRGKRPLLQHQFGPEALPLEKGEKTGVAGNDPEEWKKTCMVTSAGQLYVRSWPSYVCGGSRYPALAPQRNTGKVGISHYLH